MAEKQDIVPGLLEKLKKEFQKAYESSRKLGVLMQQIQNGSASYAEANDFAIETGELLAEVFRKNLSSDLLPDGRMYYNIAKRILEPMLEDNYHLAADAAVQVQQAMNSAAGIGLKAVSPEMNADRIRGIIDIVSGKESFDDIAYMLSEPVVNFTQSAVDDTVKANVDFQGKSGLKPRVVRRVAGNCCDWCAALAGTYTYPDVPRDVYRRHKYCRCTVTFDPGSGKVQDIWSKQWRDPEEADKIEKRKQTGLSLGTRKDPQEQIRKAEKTADSADRTLAEQKRIIRERIAGGEYSLTYPDQKYLEHVEGTAQYLNTAKGRNKEPSRLIITKEEAERLIQTYSGMGKPRVYKNGDVSNIEYAQAEHAVGKVFDDTSGKWIETRRFAIHHGKSGSHIVPVKENEND